MAPPAGFSDAYVVYLKDWDYTPVEEGFVIPWSDLTWLGYHPDEIESGPHVGLTEWAGPNHTHAYIERRTNTATNEEWWLVFLIMAHYVDADTPPPIEYDFYSGTNISRRPDRRWKQSFAGWNAGHPVDTAGDYNAGEASCVQTKVLNLNGNEINHSYPSGWDPAFYVYPCDRDITPGVVSDESGWVGNTAPTNAQPGQNGEAVFENLLRPNLDLHWYVTYRARNKGGIGQYDFSNAIVGQGMPQSIVEDVTGHYDWNRLWDAYRSPELGWSLEAFWAARFLNGATSTDPPDVYKSPHKSTIRIYPKSEAAYDGWTGPVQGAKTVLASYYNDMAGTPESFTTSTDPRSEAWGPNRTEFQTTIAMGESLITTLEVSSSETDAPNPPIAPATSGPLGGGDQYLYGTSGLAQYAPYKVHLYAPGFIHEIVEPELKCPPHLRLVQRQDRALGQKGNVPTTPLCNKAVRLIGRGEVDQNLTPGKSPRVYLPNSYF